MSSDDAGGYVHDPDDDAAAVGTNSATVETGPEQGREFDWRGWTLVGVIIVSFLVVPAIVLVRPPALPWEVALLVLPLLPAFLLGGTAVWSAVRSGKESGGS
ncbi:hypothetical protein [Halostella pelagica]|uniref:hypothetical protein n=1 Tax=Halostella pelagica TaxID=2583824 RepID=UPI0010810B32|nr:hypothetical protein [Halostella pelagica]